MSALRLNDAEISVLLAPPERMRELNMEWRGEDRAASILSFPQGDSPGPCRILGDLAIREDLKGIPDQLLIHGVLHLLGYSHDTDEEFEEMEKKAREVLDAVS